MNKVQGVSEAFLGLEDEPKNKEMLKNSQWISNPELEFCKLGSLFEILAIVRGTSQNGGNRVYRIKDYRLINVLRTHALINGSWVTFYRRKKN